VVEVRPHDDEDVDDVGADTGAYVYVRHPAGAEHVEHEGYGTSVDGYITDLHTQPQQQYQCLQKVHVCDHDLAHDMCCRSTKFTNSSCWLCGTKFAIFHPD
jgi:hypothetical protein